MRLSVILSTYNQPEWLHHVLHGYTKQTYSNFEIIIADDGSDERTGSVVQEFRRLGKFHLVHVWQEDEGFQKSRILNKATQAATGDYLIFSDGDCIPREDFVATHAQHAQLGHFLSGGYCKLPMELSKSIVNEDITTGRLFSIIWLRKNGLRGFSQTLKIGTPRFFAPLLDALTPTKPSWNGHGASGWKNDILAVNGYNESMQYGGQDRELGERLSNLGIRGKQIRHRAIVLHLDHPRGYNTAESIAKNRVTRAEVIATKSTWCDNGIQKNSIED